MKLCGQGSESPLAQKGMVLAPQSQLLCGDTLPAVKCTGKVRKRKCAPLRQDLSSDSSKKMKSRSSLKPTDPQVSCCASGCKWAGIKTTGQCGYLTLCWALSLAGQPLGLSPYTAAGGKGASRGVPGRGSLRARGKSAPLGSLRTAAGHSSRPLALTQPSFHLQALHPVGAGCLRVILKQNPAPGPHLSSG